MYHHMMSALSDLKSHRAIRTRSLSLIHILRSDQLDYAAQQLALLWHDHFLQLWLREYLFLAFFGSELFME